MRQGQASHAVTSARRPRLFFRRLLAEDPMKTSHTLQAFLLLALSSVILAACSTLGGTRVITFSEADMARLLEQHGPFQKRLLEVLDVRINRPSVRLLPES